MNETQIQKFMKTLDLTREEAIELIKEDEKVDKMTRTAEINSDQTPEQRKTAKKMKNVKRAVNAYGKTTTVTRKADNDKRELILILKTALETAGIENVEVTRTEGQLDFIKNNRRFRVVLSAPRK